MKRFQVSADSAARVERVWELLADARGWSRWASFRSSSLEREGTPPPDGVGAIRRFGTGPGVSREEVVEFDPPRHLAYRLLSGLPIRGYRADVTIEPRDGGGSTITWASSFERATIPGTGGLLTAFLRYFVGDTAKRLARAAESASDHGEAA